MTDFAQTRSLVTLESNEYRLSPFRVEDITDRYVSMLNDSQVNRFLEVRWSPQTRETVQAYVSSHYEGAEKYMWGIYASGNNLFIGTTTLSLFNRTYGSAEIGLMIGDASYWGKGASMTVLKMLINHALTTLKLRRLTGATCALNYGMNFTFKRLGFRLEGHFVKAGVSETGEYLDSFRWAILDEEWRERADKRIQ